MIYLDYSANTPVDEAVLQRFCEVERNCPGNANSRHAAGTAAKAAIDAATQSIARSLNVQPAEIIYTSGASEANNFAIKSIARLERHHGRHIISTPLEHSSVSGSLTALQEQGYEIDLVDIRQDGTVDLAHLKELLRPDTILVAVTAVDSELGVVQPVAEIAEMLKACPHCHFHVDATQAVGKLPVSFAGIDTMSLTAHKFYGLNGIGVLVKRRGLALEPLIHGGESTTLYRSGTPTVALACSLALALEKAVSELPARVEHIRALNALLESAQTYHINGADVVLAEATLDSYLDDFAFLAHKMMEMEKFDILFAIGRMDDRIQIVARSRSHAVNVGAVCSAFGGGGHAYAASASVRDKTLSEVRDGILTQLYLQEEGEKTARDYMSQPAIGIEEGHTIAEADELMLHFGLKTMPVFAPMTRRCTGLIDSQITQKAIAHGLAGAPLTDYMRRNLKTLPVTATLRDITTVIVGARQRLVPIVSGGSSVVGVVSRTDLINIFAQEPGRMNPTDRAPKSRNMGRTMRDRLPKDVLDILEKAGALGRSRQTPVYVVGGFVRDLLLKTPNHDIDLVVEGDGIGFARAFAGVLGGRGDLLGIADEHGLEEVTGQQTGARLEDAGVGAFGKDDGFGALFQGCDQLTKHIEIPPNFCAAGGRQELTGTVYTSFFRVSTPNHKKFTIFP